MIMQQENRHNLIAIKSMSKMTDILIYIISLNIFKTHNFHGQTEILFKIILKLTMKIIYLTFKY